MNPRALVLVPVTLAMLAALPASAAADGLPAVGVGLIARAARRAARGSRVVGRAGRTRASIDTRTRRLVEKRAERTLGAEDTGGSWRPIGALSAALLLLAGAGWQRARIRSGSRRVVET